jgi:hypothetical protein
MNFRNQQDRLGAGNIPGFAAKLRTLTGETPGVLYKL